MALVQADVGTPREKLSTQGEEGDAGGRNTRLVKVYFLTRDMGHILPNKPCRTFALFNFNRHKM